MVCLLEFKETAKLRKNILRKLLIFSRIVSQSGKCHNCQSDACHNCQKRHVSLYFKAARVTTGKAARVTTVKPAKSITNEKFFLFRFRFRLASEAKTTLLDSEKVVSQLYACYCATIGDWAIAEEHFLKSIVLAEKAGYLVTFEESYVWLGYCQFFKVIQVFFCVRNHFFFLFFFCFFFRVDIFPPFSNCFFRT